MVLKDFARIIDWSMLQLSRTRTPYHALMTLSALSGAKWFSTLDLASGYWQVPMDPASSDKAASVTTSGLYEWTVMHFGLISSPSTFERLMELIVAGLKFETCLIYLDDIIVYGKTFE